MKVVIVAGGDADVRDATQLDDAQLVIAADAGAAWVVAIGRRPDLIVGDLDSVDPALVERLEGEGVAVERHPAEKDAADAELALERAVAAGADRVVILGALAGERLDHELANLLLLADPQWPAVLADLRIVRHRTTVRALHGPGDLGLEPNSSVVTLLPLAGDAEGVRTSGLRYPLDGDRLAFGRSRGLSNVVVQRPASVSLERGVLLVIEIAREGDEQ